MLHWLRRTAPVVEQKASLAEPDDELFELFTGVPAGSFGVTGATALSVPAVASAIRCLSEAAACLELRVVRRENGQDIADEGHPVALLLRGQVNDWTTAHEFVRDILTQALTSDTGGTAWVNRLNGKPAEIIRYDIGKISVQYATDGSGEPTYRLDGRVLPMADIIHVRGAFAKCPMTLARDAIGAAKSMERHAGKLFKNGARPAGVIEITGTIGEQALARLKSGWRRAHEGEENAGRTAVLFNGAKFNALTLKSTDAQFLELRKFQILEIARAFRVPPSMLFELDRATWSNSEQMGKEFLTYSLEPWLQVLEGSFGRALFTDEERQQGYRVEFLRDDLTRADLGERATAYSQLIASRVINPNEARAWEGLPPYADGNTFANPNVQPKPPVPGAPA